jgi:V/A-type H+-transporting ATPase subunit D
LSSAGEPDAATETGAVALKIQYNKTFLQQVEKGLKIRLNALPTLQAKESALRLEVKRARQEVSELEAELKRAEADAVSTHRLWCEFPSSLVKLGGVDMEVRKIAGVKTPVVKDLSFETSAHSLFSLPPWIPAGMELLRTLVELHVRKETAQKKVEVLEYARRKTTQKVNLYEKVQIPEHLNAIIRIKRFLEDDENLSKSSQKILKSRMAAAEVAA